ncbi:ammonium transporter [Nonomuraea sp. NPDC049480]|uniref:ammonium transporter n=1 Tax=Nonomuraea sp. NPDC049480 TaxID=3364353 RepID=UPI0037A9BBDB
MIDSGTTAWMLVCTALVLLMTPGLAFFYGGMTRAKSVLNMMMMSFVSIIVVTVAWVLYGYSLAFDPAGDGSGFVNKIVGGLDYVGLSGVFNAVYENIIVAGGDVTPEAAAVDNFPLMVFAAFQLTFAIITVALISGAIADRAKFGAWVVFSLLWATVVYFPVAHWVWGGGWLGQLGIEDFAGGTVVHINAGAAALALALVLGKRKGWQKEPMRPHNLTMVLLGTGLLWFGWFGFNAGSELAADQTAGLAFMNTQVATAVAAGAWLVVEKLRDGHATTLGVASGAVAGLVAITPACGFVDPWAAVVIGLLAGVGCAYAVGLKYKLGFDDSLDVVGVHLVGGVIGAVSLGFVAAYPFLPGQNKGILIEGGQISQLGLQVLGPVAVGLYSFVISWILGMIIDKTMGFRIAEDAEVTGVDITTHAETGYDIGTFHASGVTSSNGPAPAPKKVDA